MSNFRENVCFCAAQYGCHYPYLVKLFFSGLLLKYNGGIKPQHKILGLPRHSCHGMHKIFADRWYLDYRKHAQVFANFVFFGGIYYELTPLFMWLVLLLEELRKGCQYDSRQDLQ